MFIHSSTYWGSDKNAGKSFFSISFLILIFLAVIGFFYFDLNESLTLQNLKAHQWELRSYYRSSPAFVIALYLLSFLLVTCLPLPGATLLTLAGGALFGFWFGVIWVTFGSVAGSTIAFLLARHALPDSVRDRSKEQFDKISSGFGQDGSMYLFSLRIIPIFPFFVVNVGMALTSITTWTYMWVSFLGMLPGTLLYVNAGSQLSRIRSLSEVISPGTLISLFVLGVFPFVAKKLTDLAFRKQHP